MPHTPVPSRERRTISRIWLAAYVAMLTGVVVGVLYARQVTLRDFDTAEARADWQEWREAAPNRSEVGGVSRRPPKSTEPPALVLMRDHFVVVMSAAVVFSSLLFGAMMVAARGAFSPSGPKQRTAGLG